VTEVPSDKANFVIQDNKDCLLTIPICVA